MASLYTNQSRNVLKSFFLMFCFFLIFLGFSFVLAIYLNNILFLYVFIVVSIAINIYSFYFSHKTIIKMTKAKEITRKEYFDFWNAAENISISIGAPLPKLYVIEDASPNAFAAGRNPNNSIIVATTGLIEMLNKQELEGVIAHEMAHIQNRDTLIMSMIVVMVGVATLILDHIIYIAISGQRRETLPLLIIVVILTPIILTMFKLAISRKREFLADASGAIYTRHPEGLAEALRKISQSDKPLKNASSATAHLFIADPFAKAKKKGRFSFQSLFATHPPVEKRITALVG